MKKLLLLFIPLVCFFGCESNKDVGYNCIEDGSGTCVESANGYFLNLEDCENYCPCDTNCGEIIDIIYTPPFAGTLVVDELGIWNVDGAHDGYSILYVRNYCSQNTGTTCCSGIGICNEFSIEYPLIGDSFCMDFQSDWIEGEINFHPVTGELLIGVGCFSTNVPFE